MKYDEILRMALIGYLPSVFVGAVGIFFGALGHSAFAVAFGLFGVILVINNLVLQVSSRLSDFSFNARTTAERTQSSHVGLDSWRQRYAALCSRIGMDELSWNAPEGYSEDEVWKHIQYLINAAAKEAEEPVARFPVNTGGPEREQATRNAWDVLRPALAPEHWNVGEAATFYGFFCWGWEAATQYHSNAIDAAQAS